MYIYTYLYIYVYIYTYIYIYINIYNLALPGCSGAGDEGGDQEASLSLFPLLLDCRSGSFTENEGPYPGGGPQHQLK